MAYLLHVLDERLPPSSQLFFQLSLFLSRSLDLPLQLRSAVSTTANVKVSRYSALFVVFHTQGAQACIAHFHLQITPCQPLPGKDRISLF